MLIDNCVVVEFTTGSINNKKKMKSARSNLQMDTVSRFNFFTRSESPLKNEVTFWGDSVHQVWRNKRAWSDKIRRKLVLYWNYFCSKKVQFLFLNCFIIILPLKIMFCYSSKTVHFYLIDFIAANLKKMILFSGMYFLNRK